MSKEVLGRALDPFFTTKEPGRGIGLGLFLTRNVISQFGGDWTFGRPRGRERRRSSPFRCGKSPTVRERVTRPRNALDIAGKDSGLVPSLGTCLIQLVEYMQHQFLQPTDNDDRALRRVCQVYNASTVVPKAFCWSTTPLCCGNACRWRWNNADFASKRRATTTKRSKSSFVDRPIWRSWT